VAKYSGLVPFGEGEEGQQRRELGIKLYYKILEAMLAAEEERLKRASVPSDFSTLLRHDSFHRCAHSPDLSSAAASPSHLIACVRALRDQIVAGMLF
jgi:hypothetical protein